MYDYQSVKKLSTGRGREERRLMLTLNYVIPLSHSLLSMKSSLLEYRPKSSAEAFLVFRTQFVISNLLFAQWYAVRKISLLDSLRGEGFKMRLYSTLLFYECKWVTAVREKEKPQITSISFSLPIHHRASLERA